MKTVILILTLTIIFLVCCAKLSEPFIKEKVLEIEYIYPTTGYARDVYVSDSVIYIAEDQGGFSIYNHFTDIQLCHVDSVIVIDKSIENARLISAVEEESLLFVYDKYGSPAGIIVFDIGDLYNPSFVFLIISDTEDFEDIKSMYCDIGSVYLFWTRRNEYTFGIFIYPITWTVSQTFSFPNSVRGFDLDSTYIYLTGEQLGLYIASRSLGNIISETNTPGEALAVKVDNNYAFVACQEAGFSVIDVSDKENPNIISSVETGFYANSIDVEGNYLVVGVYRDGAYLYDISNIEQPQFLDKIDDEEIGRYTYKVVLHNGKIYAATSRGVYKIKINQ